jgi:hypothetical protein
MVSTPVWLHFFYALVISTQVEKTYSISSKELGWSFFLGAFVSTNDQYWVGHSSIMA